MTDYYHKYLKYKQKYINIKQNYIEQTGGKSKNNPMTFVKKTRKNNYFSFYTIPPFKLIQEEITNDMRKPDKTKILVIDSGFIFDIFTNKYGGIAPYYHYMFERPDPNYHSIYINWDEVANDYKGFYINEQNKDLYFANHDYATYKKNILPSWWIKEYDNYGKDVMIFQ